MSSNKVKSVAAAFRKAATAIIAMPWALFACYLLPSWFMASLEVWRLFEHCNLWQIYRSSPYRFSTWMYHDSLGVLFDFDLTWVLYAAHMPHGLSICLSGQFSVGLSLWSFGLSSSATPVIAWLLGYLVHVWKLHFWFVWFLLQCSALASRHSIINVSSWHPMQHNICGHAGLLFHVYHSGSLMPNTLRSAWCVARLISLFQKPTKFFNPVWELFNQAIVKLQCQNHKLYAITQCFFIGEVQANSLSLATIELTPAQ